MALWRCILGVVVLLSVSVRLDAVNQGSGDASVSEKLEGIHPKPDQNSDPNQDQNGVEDQFDGGVEDSAEDEDTEDEEDEEEEDEDSNKEKTVSGQEENGSDQEDHLSVAERLELVNQNLVGDPDSTIEDGDIAVPRPHHVQKRNADRCTKRRCRWPRKRNRRVVYVPYVIANHYSASQLRTIKQAFQSFAQTTCIRFVRNYRRRFLWWRRWKYRDYLYIHSGRGCWSKIGRKRGRQNLSLQKNGCVYTGIIQHELLHALGFHHEQRRSDRDSYIRVLWRNIKKGKKHNFIKESTRNLGTPYDYGSVMHYSKMAFSKNGRPTLVARRPNVTFGRAKSMSKWDIRRVNLLYCR